MASITHFSRIFWLILLGGGLLSGCRVMVPSGALEPGLYHVNYSNDSAISNRQVYVIDSGDSLQLLLPATDERRSIARQAYASWTFKRTEVDIDVFTLPFRIRPAQLTLPAQLNSNFTAAVYLGRRIDVYNYQSTAITPTFAVRKLQSRGFGYGFFAGIGSTIVNDFVTRQPVGIEYEGVVFDVGLAAIYDARIFNVGLAVGIDYLADANRRNWIYQQRPWFGVLFGLNLN